MTIEHNLPPAIYPPRRILMGPGPSDIAASVLAALWRHQRWDISIPIFSR